MAEATAIWVRSRIQSGFWRCGLRFTREWMPVSVSAEQAATIRAERNLECSDSKPSSIDKKAKGVAKNAEQREAIADKIADRSKPKSKKSKATKPKDEE